MKNAPQNGPALLEDDYPVLDGFLFQSDLKCDLQFLPFAIREFEALRRAGSYRTKAWPVPADSKAFLIPANDSYELQLPVKPGSAIWGYSFIGSFGGLVGATIQTLAFEVRDGCDDVKLFSEAVTRQAETPAPQQALSKLYIVGPPGLLNVVISNTFPNDETGQLILWGGEPA